MAEESMKLRCGVYGEGSVFSLEIERNADVEVLQEKIAGILSTEQHTVPPKLLTLYMAGKKEGERTKWLSGGKNVDDLLQGDVDHTYQKMFSWWKLNKKELFGPSFTPADEEVIHVLVDKFDVKRQRVEHSTSDKFDVKRQRVEHSTSLAELWEHSELQLAVLPAPHQLAELLQKPLPFRLTLRDSVVANRVFSPNGPLITCSDLTLWMDHFLVLSVFRRPEATASNTYWQWYYNALLLISISLWHEKGFLVREHRCLADETGTTSLRKRPDYILQYKGLLLMRGEEMSSLESIAKARAELTTKMCRWNVMLYGDLLYMLGYATSGSDLQVVAIERSDGPCRATVILDFNIFEDKAGALKVFYNLAFLLHKMAKLTKRSYACDLVPFVPDENEKRKIVLLDGFIERTIQRTQSGGEMDVERLKSVYETLQGLDESSPVTHLQTVEKLSVKRDGRLVVELSPIALKYWHGCGYCHGDIRWRNIVLVPTSGFSYWVLIDMDESRQPNTTTIRWNHRYHGHKLRFQHDLCQLGQLMGELPFELSHDLTTMQAMLQSAVDTPELTAEVALATLEARI
ncbi:hypothetical protein F442_07435 [Phytophthora nicotianae P10297]|uniref:Crinkler effector protein N-terminal domain-containing protein n=1 Tax=Phytophthora nicotianae P10297 TaxID=1317064 RepID=W2ZJE1_PHYNI|nr:hypothetical protein F442_07435 [Phytophthora nicotianae P10297]